MFIFSDYYTLSGLLFGKLSFIYMWKGNIRTFTSLFCSLIAIKGPKPYLCYSNHMAFYISLGFYINDEYELCKADIDIAIL